MTFDPLSMIRPRRKIAGISAILLPFQPDGRVDWPAFRAHVRRTADAELTPAVNMDTGYVNLLDDATRQAILAETRALVSDFVAGAFVMDRPQDRLDIDAYRQAIDVVQGHGGTPVVFQSYGLTALQSDELLNTYRAFGRDCPRYIAFELGQMFAPFGRIYDLDTFGGLMQIPQCIGAKHSSLSRELEWQRLRLRDQRRPDFRIYTGNDLGIDMVMYGSDYLLGLSTFAPDLFAKRDRCWLEGDPAFFEINDLLQYLGFYAFRPPVPAYKHSAAMFLKLRGWIDCDATHPGSPKRPDSDREVLRDIAERISRL